MKEPIDEQTRELDEQIEKWKDTLKICPECGEIRALTVHEVKTDPLLPDSIKELIIPLLIYQRQFQRMYAGTVELAYRRGKHEGEGPSADIG